MSCDRAFQTQEASVQPTTGCRGQGEPNPHDPAVWRDRAYRAGQQRPLPMADLTARLEAARGGTLDLSGQHLAFSQTRFWRGFKDGDVGQIKMAGSWVSGLRVQGEPWKHLDAAGSLWRGVDISHYNDIGNVDAPGAVWQRVTFHSYGDGSSIRRVHVRGGNLHRVAFQALYAYDIDLRDCQLHQVRFNVPSHALQLDGARLVDCTFEDSPSSESFPATHLAWQRARDQLPPATQRALDAALARNLEHPERRPQVLERTARLFASVHLSAHDRTLLSAMLFNLATTPAFRSLPAQFAQPPESQLDQQARP